MLDILINIYNDHPPSFSSQINLLIRSNLIDDKTVFLILDVKVVRLMKQPNKVLMMMEDLQG